MTDAGFFRGTSAEQDNRFSDKHKKLLKQMKFADSLSLKVDTSKVDLDVLRPWVIKRVTDIIGMEDEVVTEFIMNQLEASKCPDPKTIQINLTGFLNGRHAREFMGELWTLLNSATNSPSGIPQELIEAKKQEILAREEAKKAKNDAESVERLMNSVNGSNESEIKPKVETSKHSSKDETPASPRRGRNGANSPSNRKTSVSPKRRSRSRSRSRSSSRSRSRSHRHHPHRHHSHRHRRKHSSHKRRHSRDESSRRRDRDRSRDRRDKVHKSKRARHSSSSSSSSDSRSESPASSTSSPHHRHHHHRKSSGSRHRRRRSRSREGRSHKSSPARSHASRKDDKDGKESRTETSRKRSETPEEERLREKALKTLRNK